MELMFPADVSLVSESREYIYTGSDPWSGVKFLHHRHVCAVRDSIFYCKTEMDIHVY